MNSLLCSFIGLEFIVMNILISHDVTIFRNNASFSNFMGGFRWQRGYPWCIIQAKSKNFPTVKKKKINLNFQNILTFFDVDKKFLDDQKHLKI
ncbi:Uncharacterized protein FWK35_00025061 [Aphis craccivora]|uniref:Uncharacterized protein n=1 Tax=Aphis craccivora TaxID=307492 RepID=A0A6G0YBI1_APHCR|nr:Uncharacterized protein FWK35_00025061 [Aphis craccivora]